MSKFKHNKLLKEALDILPNKEVIKEIASIPEPDTVNRCGFAAYSLDDEIKLLALLNSTKLEPQFYRTEGEVMKEVCDLVEKIALKDPYLVAQMIVWSRCKGEGMRSVNHLAAAKLSAFIGGEEWGKRFFSAWNKKEQRGGCIFRMDDMSEILNIFSALNKSKLTNAMKKGFASVLETSSSYSLLKYKKSVINVMNLVHPNSSASVAEVEWEGNRVKTLDAIKKKYHISADTWESAQSEAGQIVAEAVKDGKLSEEEAKQILDTAKEANWLELLVSKKLGILAALRNIRNILKVTIDPQVIEELYTLLTDTNKIKEGKIMPYQFDIAWQIVRDQCQNYDAQPRILLALQKGYIDSIPNLKEALPGKTCVMVDTSGSMWDRCVDPSRRTTISSTAANKAGLIAATIAKACPDTTILRFGSTAEFVKIDTKKNVFALGQDIVSINLGGTAISTAFDLIRQNKLSFDRIILLSDNECNAKSWDGLDWVTDSYKNYIREVCSPYVYCVDLCAYGTKPLHNESMVNYYFGYGYSMFNDISSKEFKPEAHLEEIRKIII